MPGAVCELLYGPGWIALGKLSKRFVLCWVQQVKFVLPKDASHSALTL